ncbi:MAG: transpeptidase family protein [Bryobacteraceae bacterium]|nr:transpeptidase family protein [Bryobacteraceae bacterium]
MAIQVERKSARRAIWIGRLTVFWALAVIGKLVYLQVVMHDLYVEIARSQHERVVPVRATRGDIVDRTGHPLALSIRTQSVVINPRRVVDERFFAGAVAPVLGIPAPEIEKQIVERKRRPAGAPGRSYMVLKRHVTDEEVLRLKRQPFPYIEIVPDSRREYPNGTLAAHVIGSLNREGNGNAGIEQKLNADLKGKPGTMRVLTDSLQDRYISWIEKPATEGVNLTLTLDSAIQYEAERALAEGVAAASAKKATVIVMRPEDGAILALANYPSFDPSEVVPDEAGARKAAMERRLNIAVQEPCEPGSVMKMITVTMGLDTGKYSENTLINCENGRFPRPGRKSITDLHHGYGTIPLPMVLIKSSNIGVAKVAIDLGPRTLWEYLMKFGMGRKTGIELPGETAGILRRLECKGPNDNWCWGPNSHEYIAFGHEIAATAVQLARSTAVVANGGYLVEPHLLARKQRPRADATMEDLPIVRNQARRVIDGDTSVQLRRIMQRVVLEGTGKRAQVGGWSTGGKTGSAEMFVPGQGWVNRHNSSFIGFAPVANPKVVVVVTLNDTPRQGGSVAAPVFAKVASAALRILQVPMDAPETSVPEVPEQLIAAVPEKVEMLPPDPVKPSKQDPPAAPPSPLLAGPRVPDFRGLPLVAVLRRSSALGVEVEVVGSGRAKRQDPPPGGVMPAGGRVRVEFAKP